MDERRLRELLGEGVPLLCLPRAASTSDVARDWAYRGGAHGSLVVADAQEAGRGTRGRAFHSPPGGLYVSLLLDAGDVWPGHLTTLAAVCAVTAAREATGLDVRIKWVNDLMLDERKVGGILTESVALPGRRVAIVGIGMNAGPWDAPEELRGVAGTLHREGSSVDRERIVARAVLGILKGLSLVPAHMDEYRALCGTIGRGVAFVHEGKPTEGTAVGVDGDGALRVRTAAGELRLIAGDVSVRPASGGAK